MKRPLAPIFSALVAASACSHAAVAPDRIEYNRDVRPVLAENCFKCHGFDKNARKAGLRLDNADGASAPDKDGIRAIVPGSLVDSDAHDRIHSSDPDDIMPPPKSERKLTERQIAILDRWIEQGAVYEPHWAYIAPVKSDPPAVVDPAFVKNPIDRFVLARLNENGIAHAPEADRATLCRRLHLDLLGLPPTPAEVDRFVNDASPDACEKLVDALLASPAFGERLAIYWLDLVRYADSIGYHSDNARNVWPYRDWVIRAFNENIPFDRFTIEQLAGDLLPNATMDQKVASTFNRLNMTTEEGGAQAKEYEAKTVTDRVKTVGTTWLGQTIMCAECHDHKYDPITQRDFYSLGAFFADIDESAIGGRGPGTLVAIGDGAEKLKAFDARVAVAQSSLKPDAPGVAAAQEAWERRSSESGVEAAWIDLLPVKAAGDKGSLLVIRPDATIKVEVVGSPVVDTYRITVNAPPGATAIRLDALPSDSLPLKGPGRAFNGNFVLSEFQLEQDGKPVAIRMASASFEQPGYPASKAIDGIADRSDNGWAIMGNAGKASSAYFALEKPLADKGPLTAILIQNYGDNHTLGKLKLSATTSQAPVEAPKSFVPADILALLKTPAAQRSPEQKTKVGEYYISIAPELAQARKQLVDVTRERDAFDKTLPRCLISQHTDRLRTVRILPRGNWQNETGEIVQPAVPHFLPQPKVEDGRRLTRLDLGRWFVSRENPLTARVFVNRLWKMYYGVGLSKTLEDMGSQGETPAMQPLLDWLACDFMDNGWDIKHIIRLMATSGAYRESSSAPKNLQRDDPMNRLLARQSRFRLDAEIVRDNALSIAGLLVAKIGGPSVKPYQPAGYWENLNFPEREWVADKDDNQWRRGIYTWWQRSYLQPSLLAFDAPSREECTADRMRSNIPQQALALLNDPTYVEAARAFAGRILREGGKDPTERLTFAWRQATGRAPSGTELITARALLDKNLTRYTADPKAAEELIHVGNSAPPKDAAAPELSAWTNVARAILNLHETVTRL